MKNKLKQLTLLKIKNDYKAINKLIENLTFEENYKLGELEFNIEWRIENAK